MIKKEDMHLKQVLNETIQKQDDTRRQMLKQVKEVQKMKKKAVSEDERKAMSSILSDKDIDAIF